MIEKNNKKPEERIKKIISFIGKPLSVHEICLLTGLDRNVVNKRIRKLSKWKRLRKVTKKEVSYWFIRNEWRLEK